MASPQGRKPLIPNWVSEREQRDAFCMKSHLLVQGRNPDSYSWMFPDCRLGKEVHGVRPPGGCPHRGTRDSVSVPQLEGTGDIRGAAKCSANRSLGYLSPVQRFPHVSLSSLALFSAPGASEMNINISRQQHRHLLKKECPYLFLLSLKLKVMRV